MFSRMRTGTKIVASYAVAIALLAGLGVVSYVSLGKVVGLTAAITDRRYPSAEAVQRIQEAQLRVQSALTALNIRRFDAPARHDFFAQLEGAYKDLDQGAKDWEAVPHTEIGSQKFKETWLTVERWRKDIDAAVEPQKERSRLLAAGVDGKDPKVAALDERSLDALQRVGDTYRSSAKAVDDLTDFVTARVREDGKAAKEIGAAATTVLVVAVLAFTLALVLLGVFLARGIARGIRKVAAEAARLTAAVAAGKLDVRGDADGVHFEFRPIVEGMNETMDAFAKPIRMTAECVSSIGQGKIPPKITDEYQGDFNVIRSSLNDCIGAVDALVADVGTLGQAAVEGRLAVRANAAQHKGDFRRIIEGVNLAVSTLVGHLDAVPNPVVIIDREYKIQHMNTACAQLMGRPAEQFIGQKCYDQFRTTDCNTERCACRRAMAEGRTASSETEAHPGELTLQIGYTGVPVRSRDGGVIGAFEVVSDQTALRKAAAVARKVAEYQAAESELVTVALGKLSQGDLALKLEVAPGDEDTVGARRVFEAICGSIGGCASAVERLVRDADGLARAAVEGKLTTRADAKQHQGDFGKVIAGVNRTLDAVVAPIQEAAGVLEKLSQRDLRARVSGSYQGDHARIKEAVNSTGEALHEALSQVASAVEQVSSAATQIASSSQAVASGASEQAASLEETGSSLESVSSMARQSAESAQQASLLAHSARSAATEGAAAVELLQGAMGKIKLSAEGTSQIIKDVSEIAFQTNLLALNAAVEAARAGEAGRGFAVVAEEVRSLALRAKEAATKTEELIRQSVKEAGEGELAGKQVAAKLGEIVQGVSKVTDIVAEIAAGSKQQTTGLAEVNTAVGEMDKVTQQNAASAEESSSAASELSGQAEELAAMVGAFQISRKAATAPARRAPGRSEAAHAHAQLGAAPAPAKRNGSSRKAAQPALDAFPMEDDATRDF